MRKKFVINLIFLILLNLLIKPFWIFGIERTVQNVTGAAEYGFYFSLLNFSFLLNMVLDMGITNYNNRLIAGDNRLLAGQFANVVMLKFMLAVVYAVLTLSVATIIGYTGRQMKILVPLIVNQFLLSFILYLRSNISGLQLFKTDSLISILDRFLMIVFCSLLLWGHVTDRPFGITMFVAIQTISYLITAGIAFVIVLLKARSFVVRFDGRFFISFLKRSFPYAMLVLLMSLYGRLDSVLLERLLDDGKVQAGIYAQSFRLYEAATMFGYLFASLLLPMFAKMLKHNEDTHRLASLSFHIIIVVAMTLLSICMFYNRELLRLLYWDVTDEAVRVLPLLMTGFVGVCLTYIYGTLLTANGDLKRLNGMAAVVLAVNVVLNLLLIPLLAAVGAAIASMTTQLLAGAWQMVMACKVFGFRVSAAKIRNLVVFVGLNLATAYLLSSTGVVWYGAACLVAAGSIGFAFALRLLNFGEIIGIFRQQGRSHGDAMR